MTANVPWSGSCPSSMLTAWPHLKLQLAHAPNRGRGEAAMEDMSIGGCMEMCALNEPLDSTSRMPFTCSAAPPTRGRALSAHSARIHRRMARRHSHCAKGTGTPRYFLPSLNPAPGTCNCYPCSPHFALHLVYQRVWSASPREGANKSGWPPPLGALWRATQRQS